MKDKPRGANPITIRLSYMLRLLIISVLKADNFTIVNAIFILLLLLLLLVCV